VSLQRAGIAVLAVLAAFLCCSPTQHSEMTVMTFNILYNSHKVPSGERAWQNRLPILITCLKDHTPDVLGTQEGFDFQTLAIKNAFPDWQEFGLGRYHKILAINPRRPFEDMGGCSCRILYDSSKYVLLDQGTFWHSDQPDSVGSKPWGNEMPRIVTWGKFQIIAGGKKFVVMNTHYDHGEPYIENTARLMMQKWREIAAGLPTILMGDFNLLPDSPTHELFCGQSGPAELRGNFKDCWQELRKSETSGGTSHNFTGKGKKRIDWILVTPEFKVKAIDILYDHTDNCYPSDHFPVIAKLSL
jgi:endonuclease/exonuclease/phosphatase family metal-dependent hydrolase